MAAEPTPAVPMAQIVDIVARSGAATPFHRMCISMITHPRSDADTVSVLKSWTDRIDPASVPVSILSNPTTMEREDVARLHDLGADIFTVALDAATPEIFDRTRGKGVSSPHSWAKYWDVLETFFLRQPEWASHHAPRPEMLYEYAVLVGLDQTKWKADAANPEWQRRVQQDAEDGKALGVTHTPTLFVNGQKLRQLGYEPLRSAVETALR